ncbi:DNA-directed RNA polymerase subunit omega, partial [Aciditerrimonas ferrireducens]|nr:DNA-directed RNA polymerase subunit omega [Aciditerrimonas ferrireducens]
MAQRTPTLMDPPIERLLEVTGSKFALVTLAALRARQINSYYTSLGEGLGRIAPPQVTSVSGKPLTIAFEEIAAGKALPRVPSDDEAASGEAAGHDSEDQAEGTAAAAAATVNAVPDAGLATGGDGDGEPAA